VTTTTSIDTSPTKELANSFQLHVDEDDYLQPQSSKSSPAIYLDLLDSTAPMPGKRVTAFTYLDYEEINIGLAVLQITMVWHEKFAKFCCLV